MSLKKKKTSGQVILNIFFVVLCMIIICPLLILIGVSLSNEQDVVNYGYRIIPIRIDLSAYKYVFKNPGSILNAYGVTIFSSVTVMVLSVFLMCMVAYPLTRKNFKGRSVLSFYLYFTMLFSGGLVPSYILITKYLHLGNTIWVHILPGLISPWYVFMIRTFFQGIPDEIAESVFIDGGTDYTVFFKMIIPLSKPVIAAVALFMFLAKWNDWFTSMMYITNDKLIALQYLLQRIMSNIQLIQESSGTAASSQLMEISEIPAETVRMAMAVVVAGPALVIFPFFQKYFVKGMTVGAVKG